MPIGASMSSGNYACVLQQLWPDKGITRSSVVSGMKFQSPYRKQSRLVEVLVQDKGYLEQVA